MTPEASQVPAATGFALGPIGQRRWELFKANRRSFWALWIFLVMFVVSLFAELVANDRPFFVWYDGDAYWPAFVDYKETDFDGDFPAGDKIPFQKVI